ncbi:hypothetical protein SSX86_026454 [Deinandra increscens subsp. villosa]|uniref:Homeobox domain-containing protein n=1 Tax=Deinandra increscens subsp. villosa TaxID=3103831 RepID=A0AAP0CFY2_9ASTR
MDGGNPTPEAQSPAVSGGAAVTPVASRWNPTKEQINMLENLYRQGLRTPTAEQIQEITARLQTYGHIEGKNVFYWFQNHKARQRQKERQDHLSLFRQYNRQIHHPFIHLSPPPNVVYEPCYISQNNLGFYVQQPQAIAVSPTAAARPARPASTMLPENAAAVAGRSNVMMSGDRETLDLFPMHPTGILKEPVDNATTTSNGGCYASRACTSGLTGSTVDRVYFDFFC